jgi:hypothetical protein
MRSQTLVHRFLLHLLPKGYMRVRHYGFLADRCRAQRLPQIRAALAAPAPPAEAAETYQGAPFDGYPCPRCRSGRLHVSARFIYAFVSRDPAPDEGPCPSCLSSRRRQTGHPSGSGGERETPPY